MNGFMFQYVDRVALLARLTQCRDGEARLGTVRVKRLCCL